MTEQEFFKLKEKYEVLQKAYGMLSQAGFELQVEDGYLSVWYKGSYMDFDYEEGLMIFPNEDEYHNEFEDRQDKFYS